MERKAVITVNISEQDDDDGEGTLMVAMEVADRATEGWAIAAFIEAIVESALIPETVLAFAKDGVPQIVNGKVTDLDLFPEGHVDPSV